MYEYIRLLDLQDDPKSITFTALFFGCLNRIFSGFRSQCIMSTSGRARNAKAFKTCLANLRIRFNETPPNCVFFNNSYRLSDNISNTRHWWLRYIKCVKRRTVFHHCFACGLGFRKKTGTNEKSDSEKVAFRSSQALLVVLTEIILIVLIFFEQMR